MAKKRPESLREAAGFDQIKNHALRYGLCLSCASQLAWGHQNGFVGLHEPCSSCRPKILLLPSAKGGGWKTVFGRAAAGSSWPIEARPEDSGG